MNVALTTLAIRTPRVRTHMEALSVLAMTVLNLVEKTA